ncbi:collagen binding domain-containing protein [Streptomyces sp. NPDC001663]|uniref:MSCRAMM family protein n=1 Tax=Streptomyces sp. NPDC001663 TaxID=3364597 RepID=UPI0036C5B652
MPKLTIRVFLCPRRVVKDPERWQTDWPTPSGVVLELSKQNGNAKGGYDPPVTLDATDDDGLVRHDKLAAGTYQVRVVAGPPEFDIPRVAHGGSGIDLHMSPHELPDAEIVLLSGGQRRLFLLNTQYESGQPLPGAKVDVAGTDFTSRSDGAVYAACKDELVTVSPQSCPRTRATPKDGRFVVNRGGQPLPEDMLKVIYRAATAQITIKPELNGQPVSGVVFEVTRTQGPGVPAQSRATDDRTPTCVFDDIPAGMVSVAVSDTSRATYGKARLRVAAVPGKNRINSQLNPGGSLDLSAFFEFKPLSTDSGDLYGLVVDDSDTPLQGVDVVARQDDREAVDTTDANGNYRMQGLPTGDWKVIPRTPVRVGGRRLILDTTDDHCVTVTDQGSAQVPDIVLSEEKHGIRGIVRDEGDQAVAYVTVEIHNADGTVLLGSTQTDKDGFYEWFSPTSGRFLVSVLTKGGKPVERFPVEVNSVTVSNIRFSRGGAPGGAPTGTPPSVTNQAFTDFSAFPVLTEEVGGGAGRAPAPGGDRSASYGQIVEGALRDVLGWRPGSNTSGFQTALTGAFELREVQGHTEFTWRPRGYAVQADLGALTGAQASIYQRAKNALEQITPLLDALTPLDPAADLQDTEAVRTIVRAELGELVDELAVEGGPRVQRVDELFVQLLGPRTPATQLNPDAVGGQLAQLRDRFGLSTSRVGTLDEERVVTNFRIVVDHVLALAAGWDSDRALFLGTTGQTSLGTVLIQLSRSLDVVAQSVEETASALDSVFVDAAQRQTIQLRFDSLPPRQPALLPILLSDLLDWIVRVSTAEGPRLVREAGKDGVIALTPVLGQLADLVLATEQLAASDPSLPDGVRTPRVLRALRELRTQLADAVRLARAVQRTEAPVIVFVDEVTDLRPGLSVTVVGRGFLTGATAVMAATERPELGEFTATVVTLDGIGRADTTFPTVPTILAGLTWQVTLINPDGTRSNAVEALRT